MCNNCINKTDELPDPEDVLNDLASDITTKGFVKFKDAIEAMNHFAASATNQLQAETAELKLQVSALTQALETQKRENQPYIKELESQNERFKHLLLDAKDLFNRVMSFPEPDKTVHSDIFHFRWNALEELFPSPSQPLSDLLDDKLNAPGGDKPEQAQ